MGGGSAPNPGMLDSGMVGIDDSGQMISSGPASSGPCKAVPDIPPGPEFTQDLALPEGRVIDRWKTPLPVVAPGSPLDGGTMPPPPSPKTEPVGALGSLK